MMEKGRLICSGRHTELLKTYRQYTALFNGEDSE